uniref:Alternative protein NQO1 n=1 Tax=Homo sapiens TaxID=9606 RepID=L8E9G5_HUMAN|nr:alternative protein NQO1 [Homo sapiens]
MTYYGMGSSPMTLGYNCKPRVLSTLVNSFGIIVNFYFWKSSHSTVGII